MNRYLIIHRLRWPAILLLTGVIALLDQADVLSWGRAWPLYLILFGVLTLAERATFASQPPVPPAAYPYGDPNYVDPNYPNPNYPNPGYVNPGYAGYNQTYSPGYSAPGYPAGNQNRQSGYPAQGVTPATPHSNDTSIVPASDNVSLSSTQLGTNREEEER